VFVFIKLLSNQGHELNIFDTDTSLAGNIAAETGSSAYNSIQDLLSESDTIIICTPIGITPEIIEEVSSNTSRDLRVVEISSIKNQTVLALERNSEKITPLSLHPMFGPDVDSIEGQRIVIVPVIDRDREEKFTRELFPGADIMVLDAETHDRSMALILSLPYFMNSVFLRCMVDEDLTLLRKMGGPTFRTQLALAHTILGEDPLFVESLIEDNVYAGDILTKYIDELKYLRRMLKSRPKKLVEYYEENKEEMKSDPEFSNARHIRNLFLQENQE
jgi:prephenate dehydrogenase